MVLRDGLGNFRFGASMGMQEVNEPEEVELMPIFRGLQFCAMLGIAIIILESDCLLMVNKCNVDDPDNSRLGILVLEIKKTKAHFEECTIEHVMREPNVPHIRLPAMHGRCKML